LPRWTCRARTFLPGQPVPSRPREYHPKPLLDSELDTLASSGSCHRAENSGSSRCNPVGPSSTAMTRPLHGHYPASSLQRGNPPLSGASVLSASRLESLAPFLASLNPAFPQRSPPRLLTTAACGGLRSTADCRPRRALLHLSYSYAPPCGFDLNRSSTGQHSRNGGYGISR
jgi:hypothetical protein